MDALDIARWQFGITTVYHFLFVPLTIGLTALVAILETMWVRTNKPEYLRLTKFFGRLFLINFALGLVTGIVQEFQFGMNWSDYSRFVGDIFGAPLAVEALLAFFLESTFLGLWIFGWDKLPPKLHMATMWLTHIGTLASAWFILAANSFMQNPVGLVPGSGVDGKRAELESFWAVMFNKVQLVTYPHVVLSAYMTAAAFILGISAYLYLKKADDREVYYKGIRFGAVVLTIAGLGVAISGDAQGKIMTEVQPMKMAAAEGLYQTESGADFSILSIGKLDGSSATTIIKVPGLLSFLGTGSFNGEVKGINDLQEEYAAKYDGSPLTKSDSYKPVIPVTYWSFRIMIGLGAAAFAGGLLILWLTRGRKDIPKWVATLGLLLPIAMVAGNSFGWIFTEMGRQPWIVFGLMSTATGVSPSVAAWEVMVSVVVFTLLYGVLAVVELGLLKKYIVRGADAFEQPPNVPVGGADDDAPMAFAY